MKVVASAIANRRFWHRPGRNWIYDLAITTFSTAFLIALGAATAWLAWMSLGWPLLGDATFFHFIATEIKLGAVPYRDLIDINPPLIYWIHAAILEFIGPNDLSFRIFDLSITFVIGMLTCILVWPNGRYFGILAGLSLAIYHLALGPLSAGQRDFLLLGVADSVAIISLSIFDQERRRAPCFFAAGVLAAMGALLKPTAIFLALLPFFAEFRVRRQDFFWLITGSVLVMACALSVLAASDALVPFIRSMTLFLPVYASLNRASVQGLLKSMIWAVLPVGGFTLAAGFSLFCHYSARQRVFLALVVFGVMHALAQGKGWSYHFYPLVGGLIGWGASSLGYIPNIAKRISLAAVAGCLLFQISAAARLELALDPKSVMPLPASRAMQSALSSRLAPGSVVQLLDNDAGGLQAMSQSGMRQATPHFVWTFLNAGPVGALWRKDFLQRLTSSQVDAVLVTNSQWPLPSDLGISSLQNWTELRTLLASCFTLTDDHSVNSRYHLWAGLAPVSWRLYIRRSDCPKPQP